MVVECHNALLDNLSQRNMSVSDRKLLKQKETS